MSNYKLLIESPDKEVMLELGIIEPWQIYDIEWEGDFLEDNELGPTVLPLVKAASNWERDGVKIMNISGKTEDYHTKLKYYLSNGTNFEFEQKSHPYHGTKTFITTNGNTVESPDPEYQEIMDKIGYGNTFLLAPIELYWQMKNSGKLNEIRIFVKRFDTFVNEARNSDETCNITLGYQYIDSEDEPKFSPNDPTPDQQVLIDLQITGKPEIESVKVNQAVINYDIDPVYDSFGIEDINFTVKEIRMLVEYDWYDGPDDMDGHNEEIEIIDNAPDLQSRCSHETGKLPFLPNQMTISMANGWDKSKFAYRFEIGSDV